ncbi:MAG TPA: DUF1134 domain-containing protein [Novosphingobium sp.]|nr:DUF1134 domain-containing protein [Novosphingobium sp.]
MTTQKLDARIGAWLRSAIAVMAAAACLLGSPVQAQIQSVDPDAAIDGDLGQPPASYPPPSTQAPSTPAPSPAPYNPPADPATPSSQGNGTPVDTWSQESIDPQATPTPSSSPSQTYHEDDLIGAAEGVFGKGAEGLAGIIRDLLKKQGEPNAYIVGREGGGALVVGVRYGSGTLHHKVEGQRPVYWTGPSIGFDAGAAASNAFVLVYNLNDSQELYHRFPAGEGQAYLIGGFNVSYLRRGDVVLIPVRMGAGLRLGANLGYMRFTEKQNWVPF